MPMERVMKNNLFIISKNGWSYIFYTFLAFVFCSVLDLEFFALTTLVVTLFFICIFRNPEREVMFLEEKAVTSPVDGNVISIDEINNEIFAYRVIIESDYTNVGMLRTPLNSEVVEYTLYRGGRMSKKSKLFYDLNEKVEIFFVDKYNNKIKIVHRLKKSIIPLDIELLKNRKYVQGSRYGYGLNMASELYLPKNFRFDIKIDQDIKAAETLIGYFS